MAKVRGEDGSIVLIRFSGHAFAGGCEKAQLGIPPKVFSKVHNGLRRNCMRCQTS